jgi:hypothetical protein
MIEASGSSEKPVINADIRVYTVPVPHSSNPGRHCNGKTESNSRYKRNVFGNFGKKYAAGHDLPICFQFMQSGLLRFGFCPSSAILRNTFQYPLVSSRIYPTTDKVQEPNNPVSFTIPDEGQSPNPNNPVSFRIPNDGRSPIASNPVVYRI